MSWPSIFGRLLGVTARDVFCCATSESWRSRRSPPGAAADLIRLLLAAERALVVLAGCGLFFRRLSDLVLLWVLGAFGEQGHFGRSQFAITANGKVADPQRRRSATRTSFSTLLPMASIIRRTCRLRPS